MPTLEKKGYQLSIPDWAGNLGNHLIQLSCAINVAEKTQSLLRVPEHALLTRREFDFTRAENDNCLETVESYFFYQSECFQHPIVFDCDRRAILQRHVYQSLKRRPLAEILDDLVSGVRGDQVDSDTLVINVRSGRDIFRAEPPPQNDYMQPPLSFYKHIIASHGYDDCLIVTEPDRKNPCIDALLKWKSGIRIKTHKSVADDMRTLLRATSLVLCHSTFSWCMALMSKSLETLYQPSTFQIRGVD